MRPFNSTDDCVVALRYETFPLDYGFYVCGPVLGLVIIVGLIGNLICIVTFCKTRPLPVVSFYTIPLCICDCAVLFGTFFISNLPHLLYGRLRSYGPYVQVFPYANFFSNFAYTCCVWLVVCLSIERYFALCHPLRHKIYDARRRSIVIAVSCLVLAFAYNIPRYFEIHVFDCFETRTQKPIKLLEPAPFRSLKAYWLAYKVILGPALFSLGPFLLLCYLNIRMWREVKHSRLCVLQQPVATENSRTDLHLHEQQALLDLKEPPRSPNRRGSSMEKNSGQSGSFDGRNLDSHDKQRHVLSCTLLCVVIKFLICHSLPAIIDLCEAVMDQEQFGRPLIENLVDTSTLLVAANSSLNIFIYAWCSGAFRNRMETMLKNSFSNYQSVNNIRRSSKMVHMNEMSAYGPVPTPVWGDTICRPPTYASSGFRKRHTESAGKTLKNCWSLVSCVLALYAPWKRKGLRKESTGQDSKVLPSPPIRRPAWVQSVRVRVSATCSILTATPLHRVIEQVAFSALTEWNCNLRYPWNTDIVGQIQFCFS